MGKCSHFAYICIFGVRLEVLNLFFHEGKMQNEFIAGFVGENNLLNGYLQEGTLTVGGEYFSEALRSTQSACAKQPAKICRR